MIRAGVMRRSSSSLERDADVNDLFPSDAFDKAYTTAAGRPFDLGAVTFFNRERARANMTKFRFHPPPPSIIGVPIT